MTPGIIQTIFNKYLQSQCSICKEQYGSNKYKPYIICPKFHVVCNRCMEKLFQKPKALCPICRQAIAKINRIQFRIAENYINLRKEIQEMFRVNINYAQKIPLKIVNQLFFKREFQEAINLCTELLQQANFIPIQNFKALGHPQQFNGYGIDEQLTFYYELINEKDVNVFDIIMLSSKFIDKENQLLLHLIELKQDFNHNEYILYQIGILLTNKQSPSQALQYFLNAYKINENLPKIQCWIAFAYYQIGNNAEAVKFAGRSIKKDSKDQYSSLIIILAQSNKVLKYSSTEFQKLSELISQYPTYLTPLYWLGLKFESQNLYTQALRYLKRCYEKGKSFNKAKIVAARCYISLNKPNEVIQMLGKQGQNVQCRGNYEELYQCFYSIAAAYLKMDKFHQVFKITEKMTNQKQNINIYILKAQAYIGLKNHQQAIKCYQDGLRVDPQQQRILNRLIILYKEVQAYQKIDQLPSSILDKSLNSQTYKIFGDYFYSRQNYQKSIVFLTKYLQIMDKDGDFYEKIINACCKIEDYELALKFSIAYNQNCPDNCRSWERISEISQLIMKKDDGNQGKPRKIIHLN